MTRLERLRNIGISAHIDSGKTTLAERILFYCGRIHEIHEVRGSDGVGATMDSDPIEKKRGITIQSGVTSVDWADHVLQIIDTPGHVDFTVEVERSLRSCSMALSWSCVALGACRAKRSPSIGRCAATVYPLWLSFNKMDRTGANHARVVEQLRTQLRRQVVLLQLPMGSGPEFRGVINLLTMQAITFEGVNGERVVRGAILVSIKRMRGRPGGACWRHWPCKMTLAWKPCCQVMNLVGTIARCTTPLGTRGTTYASAAGQCSLQPRCAGVAGRGRALLAVSSGSTS